MAEKSTNAAKIRYRPETAMDAAVRALAHDFEPVLTKAAKAGPIACAVFRKHGRKWKRVRGMEINPCRFCLSFREEMRGLCRGGDENRADEVVGRRRGLDSYICPAGLVDFAIPIKYGRRTVAVLFGGQVFLERWPSPLESEHLKRCRDRSRDLGCSVAEYQSRLREQAHTLPDGDALASVRASLVQIAEVFQRMLNRALLFERLAEISMSAASAFTDTSTGYDYILKAAGSVIPYDSGGILVRDESTGHFRYASALGFDGTGYSYVPGRTSGIIGLHLSTGMPLCVPDLEKYHRSLEETKTLQVDAQTGECAYRRIGDARSISSFMFCPIQTPNCGVVGAIEVSHKHVRRFTEDHLDFLRVLSGHLALCYRLYRESNLLTSVGQARNTDELLSSFLQGLRVLHPNIDECSVFMWTPNSEKLVLRATTSSDLRPKMGQGYTRTDFGLTVSVAVLRVAIMVKNVHSEDELHLVREGLEKAGCDGKEVDVRVRRNGHLRERPAQDDETCGFYGIPLVAQRGSSEIVVGVVRFSNIGQPLRISDEQRVRLQGAAKVISPILHVAAQREQWLIRAESHAFSVMMHLHSHELNNERLDVKSTLDTLVLHPGDIDVLTKLRTQYERLHNLLGEAFCIRDEEECDLAEKVRDIVEHAKTLAETRSITVKVHLPEDQPMGVRIRPICLYLFFAEGFMNAAEAMASVEGAKKQIDVTVRAKRGNPRIAEIALRDYGPGRGKGADPFLLGVTNKERPDSGQGLFLVRELLRAAGGSCCLENSPEGPGAELVASIPLMNHS